MCIRDSTYNASLMKANSMQMEMQADNSYTDSKMQKVQVDKTLANLTSLVQTTMNTYFQLLESQKTLEKSRELLQATYESTERRMAAQMATQADVLNAKKEVQAMEGNLIKMQSSIDSVSYTHLRHGDRGGEHVGRPGEPVQDAGSLPDRGHFPAGV